MKALLTGANGYIGTRLLPLLLEKGIIIGVGSASFEIPKFCGEASDYGCTQMAL